MSLTLLGHAAHLSLGSSVSTLCHPTHCVMGASATSTYINYLKALSVLYEFIHSFTPFFFLFIFIDHYWHADIIWPESVSIPQPLLSQACT